jgi:hypothetical protein
VSFFVEEKWESDGDQSHEKDRHKEKTKTPLAPHFNCVCLLAILLVKLEISSDDWLHHHVPIGLPIP